MTMAPAWPAGALWICNPVIVFALANLYIRKNSTEPDVSAPDESKTSCTRMVAVAEALIVVGGVSFWGNMYRRNGTVRTVSALRPAARRIHVKTATARVLCTCHLHFNAYSE